MKKLLYVFVLLLAINLINCDDNDNEESYDDVRVNQDNVRVVRSECAPGSCRQRREQLVGAPTAVSSDDKEAAELLQAGLQTFALSDGGSTFKILGITHVSRQVVAGTNWVIRANLEGPDGTPLNCKATIWSRLWIKTDDANKVTLTCDGNDPINFNFANPPRSDSSTERRKRSLLYDRRAHKDDQLYTHYKTDYEIQQEILFSKFIEKYNRNYRNAEETAMRLRIFKNNLYIIEQLNEREQGTAKYGVSEFADMTSEEYKQRTGLLTRTHDTNEIKNPMAVIPDNIDLPTSFDWRDQNVVTKVKDQGSCGSCWAFSVTGNIEGLNAIKNGRLQEFSEQELVDCDTTDNGCNGGLPDNAYKAIEKLGGLETESDYPYTAKGGQCHFNKSLSQVQVTGAVDLPQNETAMALYLIQNGPLSIGINANAMQFYRGGISHPYKLLCRHSNIDHGVLIVGFGVSEYPALNKSLPYWIVKNSWGPSWGEHGYYRVFRGDNTCGLNSMVSSAVL